jgi:cytochrome c-type biogenesis protein
VAALVEAFTLGLVSAATPCLLPLYPGFVAFLAANGANLDRPRSTALIGLNVLLGVLVAVVVAAIIVTLLAVPLGSILAVLVPLADVVVIALGALLLVGRNAFERLPGMVVPRGGSPLRRAFAYGLLFGPLALPCAGPFLVALFAISLGPLDAVGRLATFLAFGLGAGAPLVALSLVSAARGMALARAIAGHHALLERLAGVLLVIAAAGDLVASWPAILAGLPAIVGQRHAIGI